MFEVEGEIIEVLSASVVNKWLPKPGEIMPKKSADVKQRFILSPDKKHKPLGDLCLVSFSYNPDIIKYQKVKVKILPECAEYKGKWLTLLRLWKMEVMPKEDLPFKKDLFDD